MKSNKRKFIEKYISGAWNLDLAEKQLNAAIQADNPEQFSRTDMLLFGETCIKHRLQRALIHIKPKTTEELLYEYQIEYQSHQSPNK